MLMPQLMKLSEFLLPDGSISSRTIPAAFSLALIVATDPAGATDVTTTNNVPAMVHTDARLQKLSGMSVEELINQKVTILGPSQAISKTPAAVSIVTQEDIERSGARN